MKVRNQALFMLIDIVLSVTAILLAVWLRFEGRIPPEYLLRLRAYACIAAGTVAGSGLLFGTYKSVLQYMGFADAFRQIAACVFSAAIFLIVKYTGLYPVSGSITVIYTGIVLILTTAVRLLPRFRHWLESRHHQGARRTLIIGAGTTGAMVIKRLEENSEEAFYPVAAVDDDPGKLHMRVAGVTVAANLDQIPGVARKYSVEEAILAIPSLEKARISEIYAKCASCGVRLRLFRTTVDMESYIAGDRQALKRVDIEDLLFRDSIRLDKNLIFRCLQGKTVLVTGGAGSIGSELCRQALLHECAKLIIFDIDENGLFKLNEELKRVYPPERYALCLGSVRDTDRLERVFRDWRPHLVFHAAAHKHVPMLEGNPFEAVKNNIAGTENVIRACLASETERFILISTDKAVNPANVMGASKRVAELLTQCQSSRECRMAAVRFGNVLESKGSVIPTFKKQIEMGGPVTVTHQDMERYFITIPEAVSLVMIAATLAEGGEIFVLDMGKPVKIYDLARELIRLSGLEPDRDIEIRFTGVRPGEKLSEELILDSESMDATAQEKLFVMKNKGIDPERLRADLAAVKEAARDGDEAKLRAALMKASC